MPAMHSDSPLMPGLPAAAVFQVKVVKKTKVGATISIQNVNRAGQCPSYVSAFPCNQGGNTLDMFDKVSFKLIRDLDAPSDLSNLLSNDAC